MKKQYLGLTLTLGIILAIFGSFILYNQWPLITGKNVVLATEPVDPFDPFRGQYMTINYEISRINLNDIQEVEKGDSVYVLLKEDEQGIWRYKDFSLSKPSKEYFIKGKVERIYGDTARVKYGIEQFFFERGADIPTRNITVEVSVSNSGRAKLIQLLQNGEPIEIEYDDFNLRR